MTKTYARIASGTLWGLALCLTAGGCATGDYGDYGYGDYDYYEPYPSSYSHAGGYNGYGPGHDAHDHYRYRQYRNYVRRNRVPEDARVVAEGKGTLMHQADRDGVVYVKDARTGKLVYERPVRAGDKFTLDPANNRALVDGNVVKREITRKRHSNRVFFDDRELTRREQRAAERVARPRGGEAR